MKKTIFANCSASAVDFERQKAISLLEHLLAWNPDHRPKSMQEVLAHPFWKASGDVEHLDVGQHRKIVLGVVLSTLETHVAGYCTTAAGSFLERCHNSVMEGKTWREAVEGQARKGRKPNLKGNSGGWWGDVNQNKARDRKRPMRCSVCGTMVSRHDVHFKEEEQVMFFMNGWRVGQVLEVVRDEHRTQYRLPHPYEKDKKLLLLKDPEDICAAVDEQCECRHVDGHHGTLQDVPELRSEDYYDFQLYSIWDVARLFFPYGHQDFKEDFHAHDGTNLFNLLAAISSHDEALAEAAEKAREARNGFAHAGPRVSYDEFRVAIGNITNLADRTGGTAGSEAWDKADGMVKAVEARGGE